MTTSRVCSIVGCSNPFRARGLCVNHYQAARKSGQLQPTRANATPGAALKFIEDMLLRETDDCIAWPFGKHRNGYGITFSNGRRVDAHRYVCIRAHGEPPFADAQATHSCGKGHCSCVNWRHLTWGSSQSNADDAVRHGATTRGERNYGAKLTTAEVIQIRGDHEASVKALATKFGVSQSNISSIRLRRTWGHLP